MNALQSGYDVSFKRQHIALTMLVAHHSLPRECRTKTICIANTRVVQLVASTFKLLSVRGVVVLRSLRYQIEQGQH